MATATATSATTFTHNAKQERKVIFASSLGTVFEWYDFYLYGSLSAIISRQFFAGVNETTGFIFALLAFAAGFFVRPFGALVFGRLGDKLGRKHTFLITILIMGSSTALVGLLPNYASIGVAAPVALVALRLLQGLALGGEYGGAAVYVAEHAPEGQRGLYTSWIQTTATLGLLLSLIVILLVQGYVNGNYPDAPLLDAAGVALMNAARIGPALIGDRVHAQLARVCCCLPTRVTRATAPWTSGRRVRFERMRSPPTALPPRTNS